MRRVLPFLMTLLIGCAGQTSRKPPIEIFADMDRQPKYKTQAAGAFFADGRASRRPVAGTVAQGQLKEDAIFYAGAEGGMYAGRNPLPVTRDLLVQGQERFNISCAPCHDRAGSGRGIVGARSMWLATSLHDQRIKDMVDGELFDVITHGRRSMPGYRFQTSEQERWAIVAYVRALQRATSGTLADVPEELRQELR
ncbi:MAG: cytochrome c [Bryobacteraceae bacterium]|nr:cytochrome c [Bryobacteraceae bacterium]